MAILLVVIGFVPLLQAKASSMHHFLHGGAPSTASINILFTIVHYRRIFSVVSCQQLQDRGSDYFYVIVGFNFVSRVFFLLVGFRQIRD